jgi:hypothetical protein
MKSAVLTGIFSKFSGSALATALTSRMYSRYAPQNTTFPYAVVDLSTGISDPIFALDIEDFDVVFNLFSKSPGETEITGLYSNLIALYDDCSLTITGYTHIYMQRELTRSLSDPVLGVRQEYVLYNLKISK